MKITLELWDDQCGFNKDDINSTLWVMKVNGEAFPDGGCLVTIPMAHKIVGELMGIEDTLYA